MATMKSSPMLLCLLIVLGGSVWGCKGTSTKDEIDRGRYLAAIMDCGGCHTGGAMLGYPDPDLTLAGSNVGFQVPGLGTYFPPNLTPERDTGLGAWTEQDIARALREGLRLDGRQLAPIMPRHTYAALTESDALALAAYLKSLPPVRFQAPGPFGPSEDPYAPFLAPISPS